MKRNKHLLGMFALSLPAEWQDITENHSNVFSFVRTEGVGALQFTIALYKSGKKPEISLNDLKGMLYDFCEKRSLKNSDDWLVKDNGNLIVGATFNMQSRFLRVWYVSDRKNVAFITYNCRWDDRDIEIEECEEIVASIEFLKLEA